MSLKLSRDHIQILQDHVFYATICFAVFFLVVLARLYYLQIVRGPYYRAFAQGNTIKEVRYKATRGFILDRKGRVIANNRPSFDLIMIPQYVVNREGMVRTVLALSPLSEDEVQEKWREAQTLPPFQPLVLKADVDFDLVAKIRTLKSVAYSAGDLYDLRGIEIVSHPLRQYPYRTVGAGVVGYIREISKRDLKTFSLTSPGVYYAGDNTGVAGIERQWESYLKGKDGYEQKIVDAVGNEVKGYDIAGLLTQEEAKYGSNVVTTLDLDLQEYAETLFNQRAGALIVLDVNSGAILTMVSQPTYDPSRLMLTVSPQEWRALTEDPGNIFLNRAIQAAYPPGSIHKIMTAMAAMEEKVIEPDKKVYCPGYYHYGNNFFRCWKDGGHGTVNFQEAIAESCDVYFYQLGLKLGVDRLAHYAHLWGLGQKTGIDLEGEKSGLIPTRQWKKKWHNSDWQEGETLSVAIGQGYNLVTPLQAVIMTAQLANGGRRITPYLVERIGRVEGEVEYVRDKAPVDSIPVSAETLEALRRALEAAVLGPGGTARRVLSTVTSIAGKTGTAQVVSEQLKRKLLAQGRARREVEDHAWFVGYAPTDRPEIAVSVLVENGGSGGAMAAPLAKSVIEKYFSLKGSEDVRETSSVSF